MRRIILSALLLVCCSRLAFAGTAAPAPSAAAIEAPPPRSMLRVDHEAEEAERRQAEAETAEMMGRAHDFLSLDRTGSVPAVGVSIAAARLGDGRELGLEGVDGDILAVRTELWARWVGASGLGLLAALPVFYTQEDDGTNHDLGGVGNAELSVFFVRDAGSSQVHIRAGVLLPLAPSEPADAYGSLIAASTRLTDLTQATPGATYLRFSLSPVLHRGRLLVRADLGADVPLSHADTRLNFAPIDPQVICRFNLAAAIVAGPIDVTAELTTSRILEQFGDDGATVAAATFGLRYSASRLQPHIGISVPITDDPLGHSIIAGIVVPFGG